MTGGNLTRWKSCTMLAESPSSNSGTGTLMSSTCSNSSTWMCSSSSRGFANLGMSIAFNCGTNSYHVTPAIGQTRSNKFRRQLSPRSERIPGQCTPRHRNTRRHRHPASGQGHTQQHVYCRLTLMLKFSLAPDQLQFSYNHKGER